MLGLGAPKPESLHGGAERAWPAKVTEWMRAKQMDTIVHRPGAIEACRGQSHLILEQLCPPRGMQRCYSTDNLGPRSDSMMLSSCTNLVLGLLLSRAALGISYKVYWRVLEFPRSECLDSTGPRRGILRVNPQVERFPWKSNVELMRNVL